MATPEEPLIEQIEEEDPGGQPPEEGEERRRRPQPSQDQDPQGATAWCNWCQQEVVPEWDHMVWSCIAFAKGRPRLPERRLQRRLAWPMTGDKLYDVQVAAHAARVRAEVLQRRRAQRAPTAQWQGEEEV